MTMSMSVSPAIAAVVSEGQIDLDKEYLEKLKTFAAGLRGPARRAFQASVALRYCAGSPRQAEYLFGWGRRAVALGLNELRTGIICLGAHSAFSGAKPWEEKYPEVAKALLDLVQRQAKSASNGASKLRQMTAAEALKNLRTLGFAEEALPSPSTMAVVLNRNGLLPARTYRRCCTQ